MMDDLKKETRNIQIDAYTSVSEAYKTIGDLYIKTYQLSQQYRINKYAYNLSKRELDKFIKLEDTLLSNAAE